MLEGAEQGTVEWFAEREGMITCSRLSDVFRRSSAYALEIAREREGFVSRERRRSEPAPIAWGHKHEPRARAAYEMIRDVEVTQVGFRVHPDMPYFGGSADGVVFEGGEAVGIVEIKCPFDAGYHAMSIASGFHRRDEQLPQVEGLIEIWGVEWCDFVSYDPRLEPNPQALVITRVRRDPERWAQARRLVEGFEEWIQGGVPEAVDPLSMDLPTLF